MERQTIVVLSALGLGAGAGAWYFLDPKQGKKRRRQVRDQALVLGHDVRRQGRKVARNVSRVAGSAISAALASISRPATPEELADRVQTRVAKLGSLPGVTAAVTNGRVELSGPVLAEEADGLVARVRAMSGVSEVVNKLDPLVRLSDIREPQSGNGYETAQEVTPQAAQGRTWSTGASRALVGAGSALGLVGLGLLTRGALHLRTSH